MHPIARLLLWLRRFVDWADNTLPCPYTSNCQRCDNCGRCKYHEAPCNPRYTEALKED